jgi:peptide/nickel transport system permease protein
MSEPAAASIAPDAGLQHAPRRELTLRLLRNPAVLIGGSVLVLLALLSVLAPALGTVDPTLLDPANRDLLPGSAGEVTALTGETQPHRFWMGTDSYGRDIYSRVLYGGRVSLVVGVTVALLSLAIGLSIGLVAGYVRWLDSVVMRVMDGLMAIPGILLAIALVAMWRASLATVILAIAVPEIPRVTRLVRSLVLTIREEPYVEAARSVGTPTLAMLYRHVLPNTLAPLIVQGTYICAAAILVEAILSFLGVGLSTDIPTWGNIMAEGRLQFQQFPHNVLFPGLFLALTVLAVNMLGDGLRDTLDPRFSRRAAGLARGGQP